MPDQASYGARSPLISYVINDKPKSSGTRPMCANSSRTLADVINEPTNRSTGAVECLVKPKLYLEPVPATGRVPYERRRIV